MASKIICHKINNFMIEEQSEYCFKELSNGIYFSSKGSNKESFVSSENVIKLLNSKRKTYVIGKNNFYSNFEI